LNCPALQNFSGSTASREFQRVVGACGQALDHRWRYANGRWVHASDLFTSAPAAEDLAAVILRRASAERRPLWRLVWLLLRAGVRVARRPIESDVPGPGGAVTPVSMNAVGLVDLLNDAAEHPTIYQAIDAAARAELDDRDPAPLLRLYAQRLYADEDYFGEPASQYSVELYLAVSCLDYPQLFDMSSPPAARAAQLAHAEASLPEATFRPFTVAEWIAQDQNTENYSACLQWPSPASPQPPVSNTPQLPRTMPVLVVGGQLDTWTPPSAIPSILAQIGGHSRFIAFANTTHVVGEGDTTCGSSLVHAFVADPRSIDSLDASCAATVSAIHAVGVYRDRHAHHRRQPSRRSDRHRNADRDCTGPAASNPPCGLDNGRVQRPRGRQRRHRRPPGARHDARAVAP
jgi:hypothetical protein